MISRRLKCVSTSQAKQQQPPTDALVIILLAQPGGKIPWPSSPPLKNVFCIILGRLFLSVSQREMISARSYIRTDVRCPKQIPEDHKLRRVGRDRAPTELHIRWCSGRGSTQLTPHSKQASDSSLVISVYSIRSDHRSSSRGALLLQLTSAAAFYL